MSFSSSSRFRGIWVDCCCCFFVRFLFLNPLGGRKLVFFLSFAHRSAALKCFPSFIRLSFFTKLKTPISKLQREPGKGNMPANQAALFSHQSVSSFVWSSNKRNEIFLLGGRFFFIQLEKNIIVMESSFSEVDLRCHFRFRFCWDLFRRKRCNERKYLLWHPDTFDNPYLRGIRLLLWDTADARFSSCVLLQKD